MVFADNALKLASFTPQAQEEVWGKNPNAKLSNAVAPLGKGRWWKAACKWTGRHPFSSGVDHADWVMATGYVQRGEKKQTVSVLIPEEATSRSSMTGTWSASPAPAARPSRSTVPSFPSTVS